MSNEHEFWITGVGAVTPLGSEFECIAENLLAGRSGIGKLTSFDASEHPSQIAAELSEIPCPPSQDLEAFRNRPRMDQALFWCAERALRDSGWWEERSEVRFGVVLGLGAEWLRVWELDALRGGDRVHNPARDAESLVEQARRELQLSGPAVSVSAACASGNYAIALARRWLQRGWVDVCLTGACDLSVTPMGMAGFGNLRALSRRNHEPQAASRPFDRGRDGFVVGEGGALFVLERAATAEKRGARAYAAVAGCGASSDAYHLVIPSPHPEPAIAAMHQALAEANVRPEQIDYVNAHATSTPVGDAAETRVLRTVLGAAADDVPVSSTKSMTGHLLTAAAAVEALACLVAIDRNALPPTINLHDPDPECNLRHVANRSFSHEVRVAVSNSFGFGGSNSCLVLRKVA